MSPSEWKQLLDRILETFTIRYDDFSAEAYRPYRQRRIVGFVRFERREILFDQDIEGSTEEVTWAHEALSIHYYHFLGIIRHDDEVEREARSLCKDAAYVEILRKYIQKARTGAIQDNPRK
ncbi:MAG: hypothetical protein ACMUIL_05690 [bacterium]